MYKYIHTYILYTYIQTYIHTFIHSYIQYTYINAYIYIIYYLQTCTHTYSINLCMYIYSCKYLTFIKHTYIYMLICINNEEWGFYLRTYWCHDFPFRSCHHLILCHAIMICTSITGYNQDQAFLRHALFENIHMYNFLIGKIFIGAS